MTTTTDLPPRPDPTRTGAVWVTGTGTFLLLAAAAVFTAMRWQQIPDAAKLAALALATGACLATGRTLRTSLPATAGALFHLGIFLVPLDVAAIGMRADLGWEGLLLAQGLAATLAFGWGAHLERSVVLRSAFAVAVVVLAGGIGAVFGVPAPLVLAGAALLAVSLRRDTLAASWAGLAGLSPLLAFIEEAGFVGSGTLGHLGLTGDEARLAAVVTGLTAAAVLATIGRRRHDPTFVLIGVAFGALGATATWTSTEPGPAASAVALATIFLVVEVVAYLTERDTFWRKPSATVAVGAEWLAGPAVLGALAAVVFATISLPFDRTATDAQTAVAFATLAVGWLVADRRRGGRGVWFAGVGAAACTAGAVAAAWSTSLPLGLTLLAIAAVAAASGHRAAFPITVIAATWTPLAVHDTRWAIAAAGVTGGLLVAEAVVDRGRQLVSGPRPVDDAAGWACAAAALLPGAVALGMLADGFGAGGGGQLAALLGAALTTTVLAAVLDLDPTASGVGRGAVARLGSVALLAGTAGLSPAEVGILATVLAALSIGDALLHRDPRIALGASVAVPVAIAAFAHTQVSLPASGVALTLGAAVIAGLGALLGRRWTLPVVTTVGLAVVGGLVLAAAQPSTFADAVMVASGILLAASIERGRLDGVALAGLTLTGGIWLRLADGGVDASEPYLLPVALLLLGAGARARSTGTSSWIAYGPVIGLFGGAALAERVAGGPGWHALVAGGVGVLAVVAGGQRRLAAPLFLGTGLLVALVAYETFAITAGLPTWSWLALGGSILLGAGVAMERHDLSPIETGKRLVDVVDERFA